MSRPMRSACIIVLVYVVATPSDFAYVDPGSSMLVMLALIAWGGGIIAFVRHPIQKLGPLLISLLGKRDA